MILATGMIGLYIAIGVIVLLAVILITIYNGLVQKRVACNEGWSQIDVQLKRRYDLIPNLVETVKGYASHESETLENVIKARNTAIAADGVAEQRRVRDAANVAVRFIGQVIHQVETPSSKMVGAVTFGRHARACPACAAEAASARRRPGHPRSSCR